MAGTSSGRRRFCRHWRGKIPRGSRRPKSGPSVQRRLPRAPPHGSPSGTLYPRATFAGFAVSPEYRLASPDPLLAGSGDGRQTTWRPGCGARSLQAPGAARVAAAGVRAPLPASRAGARRGRQGERATGARSGREPRAGWPASGRAGAGARARRAGRARRRAQGRGAGAGTGRGRSPEAAAEAGRGGPGAPSRSRGGSACPAPAAAWPPPPPPLPPRAPGARPDMSEADRVTPRPPRRRRRGGGCARGEEREGAGREKLPPIVSAGASALGDAGRGPRGAPTAGREGGRGRPGTRFSSREPRTRPGRSAQAALPRG